MSFEDIQGASSGKRQTLTVMDNPPPPPSVLTISVLSSKSFIELDNAYKDLKGRVASFNEFSLLMCDRLEWAKQALSQNHPKSETIKNEIVEMVGGFPNVYDEALSGLTQLRALENKIGEIQSPDVDENTFTILPMLKRAIIEITCLKMSIVTAVNNIGDEYNQFSQMIPLLPKVTVKRFTIDTTKPYANS